MSRRLSCRIDDDHLLCYVHGSSRSPWATCRLHVGCGESRVLPMNGSSLPLVCYRNVTEYGYVLSGPGPRPRLWTAQGLQGEQRLRVWSQKRNRVLSRYGTSLTHTTSNDPAVLQKLPRRFGHPCRCNRLRRCAGLLLPHSLADFPSHTPSRGSR